VNAFQEALYDEGDGTLKMSGKKKKDTNLR
jgi:hypothetical protein